MSNSEHNLKSPTTSTDKAVADADNNLILLLDALEKIDENKPSAKLNEKSMIGNNGSRIHY